MPSAPAGRREAGIAPLTEDDIIQRLTAMRPPGHRISPKRSAEKAAIRGDHDLNPDLYDPDQQATDAAVLVPIMRRETEPTVLLTRRTEHLHHHAGQISFPGGRIDLDDADAEAAALREAEEEIGLPRRHVDLLGRLDTYLVRTGFQIFPVVGLVTPGFEIQPDSFEVAEVFEVPLTFFLEPENRQCHSRIFKGLERRFYVFPYRHYYIWGATAGMLVNLAEVLMQERTD